MTQEEALAWFQRRKGIGLSDRCQEAEDWAIRALEIMRMPQVDAGWISVKDRLPEDGVFVLVCNDDGHMMIAKYESEMGHWEYKYTNYDHDIWDDDEQGPVCWWMPLPEPLNDYSGIGQAFSPD